MNLQALTPLFVDQAYTLAREANTALTLEDWRRFATPRTVREPTELKSPGIMLIISNDIIRGLAAFQSTDDPNGSRTLCAEHIVIMDRARKEQVSRELLAGLLDMALRDDCAKVHAVLPRSSAWLDKPWSDPGGSVYRLPINCVRATVPLANATNDGTVVSLRTPSA
ncbi:MAG: hypothetical protein HOJ90_14680 [Alphaproteobacteria bacterium]|nr:hypothetical protein [Alphaproteobacteria bacterium]